MLRVLLKFLVWQGMVLLSGVQSENRVSGRARSETLRPNEDDARRRQMRIPWAVGGGWSSDERRHEKGMTLADAVESSSLCLPRLSASLLGAVRGGVGRFYLYFVIYFFYIGILEYWCYHSWNRLSIMYISILSNNIVVYYLLLLLRYKILKILRNQQYHTILMLCVKCINIIWSILLFLFGL